MLECPVPEVLERNRDGRALRSRQARAIDVDEVIEGLTAGGNMIGLDGGCEDA
jgi:hypothetical protein